MKDLPYPKKTTLTGRPTPGLNNEDIHIEERSTTEVNTPPRLLLHDLTQHYTAAHASRVLVLATSSFLDSFAKLVRVTMSESRIPPQHQHARIRYIKRRFRQRKTISASSFIVQS